VKSALCRKSLQKRVHVIKIACCYRRTVIKKEMSCQTLAFLLIAVLVLDTQINLNVINTMEVEVDTQ